MSALHTDAWLQHRQFGIVIDAGSSGSRIHIYSWINREHLQQTSPAREIIGVLPTIEPGVESDSPHAGEWTAKTEPGIADFKDRPEDVGEHLEPLLDHALAVIPESEIHRTPIYLLATAGLRLVQDDIREQILANSCRYIKENYAFEIGECNTHIKNITGEEEGIYGWVAINYLMGGFDNGGVKMIKPSVPGSEQHGSEDTESVPLIDSHNPDDGLDLAGPDSGTSEWDSTNNRPFPHRHTLGFLDMGGASTQIAFEPSPAASEEHFNDLTTVDLKTLDGQTMEYHVFVTTFLGYGSNQARRRYVKDYLLSNNKDLIETQDPEDQIAIEDPCLPRRLQLSETHTMPHVPLMGTGSFSECLKRVEVLLNKDKECSDVPCLFNGVHTPPIDFNINTFIGVSEYWYSSHDILGLGGAYDYAEFEQKSAEFCNSEWEDIIARPEFQDQPHERLEMQCFKSAWLSNVLHGGFGLPRFGEKGAVGSEEQSNEVLEKADESITNKNWKSPFQSINAIKDIQVTWTLGAMLLISSGSLGQSGNAGGIHEGGHRPTQQILPPADHKAPHEDSYPERMLDSYNHFMLLVIAMFALAVFWVYRSRSSKSWPIIKRWISPSSPSSGGGGGDGLPFFRRFRWSNGIAGADYSALESGTTGSAGSYGRVFSPRASLKVMYLSVVHHTRSIWWSISSRIWPEPASFGLMEGRPDEMMESITIAGYDGNANATTTIPMSGVASHHGGTPAGSFGSSGLSSIPESNNAPGAFDPSYHRTHSSPASAGSSKPPKSAPKFFRMNKKRFSGDSQSLFAMKDGRGNSVSAEGCVVNTALLQKLPQSSIELTARSGSSTNSPNLWSNNNSSSVSVNNGNNLNSSSLNTPNYLNSGGSSPQPPTTSTTYSDHLQIPGSSGWKQGWIPEGEMDQAPIPSLLTTSRSYNTVSHSSGNSPLLAPMARYKLQQDGSASAPSSSLNLSGVGNTGFGSGFGTSADEREEWSADDDDGDDEGDDHMDHQHQHHSHSRTSIHTNTSYHQFRQHAQLNQQQYHPPRSASAVPFSNQSGIPNPQQMGLSHSQSSSAVPTAGSRYKHRSNGLLSGTNFESGGGAMTTLDDNESASEGGYLSGGSSSAGGGYRHQNHHYRPSPIQTGGLKQATRAPISRSASPMMSQQNSTSTSSLVLGRHNVSEQDQQLVSRGSSETLRRGSMGVIMSP
ncbi:Golgi apyrase [Dissophora globulifera]|nr:Golgi apyrase [Dissophora globulifera]